MTPVDLIGWGFALAIAIVVVGLAFYVVLALYWGLQKARNRDRG